MSDSENTGPVTGEEAGKKSEDDKDANKRKGVSSGSDSFCFIADMFSSGADVFSSGEGCCLAEAAVGLAVPDCFVATAALRPDEHPDLDILRAFRDQVLAKSGPGLLFIRLYYRWGRYAAMAIRGRPYLRAVVRACLVKPMARLARRVLKA